MVARDVLSCGVFKAQKGFVLLMIWTLCCLLIGPIWQGLPLVFISRQFTGSLAAETEGDDDKESVGGGGGTKEGDVLQIPVYRFDLNTISRRLRCEGGAITETS